MDGSGTAFLHDTPSLSSLTAGISGGILYVEDFDLELAPPSQDDADPVTQEPASPVITADDLEAARSAGHAEGVQAALTDAGLLQAQLQSACLQGLADALGNARSTLERVVRGQAEDSARIMLALLQAALPATMARHAECEINAVLLALLPGLACEPELRVRAAPTVADAIRETLIGLLPKDGGVLSVAADATLAEGDVRVAWLHGHARRDTAAIWTQIRAALAPLGLPTIEDVCDGCRH